MLSGQVSEVGTCLEYTGRPSETIHPQRTQKGSRPEQPSLHSGPFSGRRRRHAHGAAGAASTRTLERPTLGSVPSDLFDPYVTQMSHIFTQRAWVRTVPSDRMLQSPAPHTTYGSLREYMAHLCYKWLNYEVRMHRRPAYENGPWMLAQTK